MHVKLREHGVWVNGNDLLHAGVNRIQHGKRSGNAQVVVVGSARPARARIEVFSQRCAVGGGESGPGQSPLRVEICVVKYRYPSRGGVVDWQEASVSPDVNRAAYRSD